MKARGVTRESHVRGTGRGSRRVPGGVRAARHHRRLGAGVGLVGRGVGKPGPACCREWAVG